MEIVNEAFRIISQLFRRPYRRFLEHRRRQPRAMPTSEDRFLSWKASSVRPFPQLRKRALTIPLPSGTQQRTNDQSQSDLLSKIPLKLRRMIYRDAPQQRTNDQSQSDLLSKLPLELRRMIYREALGGQVLHLYYLCKRLAHIRCRKRTTQQIYAPDLCELPWCGTGLPWCGTASNGPGSAKDPWWREGLLPLLMTCRQVYDSNLCSEPRDCTCES